MKNKNYLLLCLSLICLSTQTRRSLSSSASDSEKVWNHIKDPNQKHILNVLHEYHNASAILHFIELTHNITNSKNCIRQSLSSLNFSVKYSNYKKFSLQSETALKTSNLLTNLFTINESLPPPVLHREFFNSLVRANLQSDPFIFGSGIAFNAKAFAGSGTNDWHFAPFAFRNVTNNQIISIDLSSQWTGVSQGYNMQTDNNSLSGDWFWAFATNNYKEILSLWHKNISHNFLQTSESGVWTSPYYDCGATNTWLITYVVPFFGSSYSDNKFYTELK